MGANNYDLGLYVFKNYIFNFNYPRNNVSGRESELYIYTADVPIFFHYLGREISVVS